MNFEEELRLALRREQAPPNFAARVLAKAEGLPRSHPAGQPSSWGVKAWRVRAWMPLAAGVALLVLVPAAVLREQDQERQARDGARAEQQLVRALRLTNSKLKQTQSLLREMSQR